MLKSIIQQDKTQCYICGKNGNSDYFGLEEHHIFGGSCRKESERFGLKVYLCKYHHTGDINGNREAVHFNKEFAEHLKEEAQKKAMEHYNWELKKWREHFRINYL